MKTSNLKRSTGPLLAFAMIFTMSFAAIGPSQAADVDPAATTILKKMTDYLVGLQQFSVHTRNTLEDVLDSGQRVDLDVSASVVISRPNKLRAERKGDLLDQVFYYDGKVLTLHNPSHKVYATVAAPETIEGMLDFVRVSLGLLVPASDLIYRDAYALLMEDVSSAIVVGKAMIGGVRCDHLAFSRPGVDFQVWVADDGPPVPLKYVVTDTATEARLSVVTLISDWDMAPDMGDASFSFVPPQDAKAIEFMRLDVVSESTN
jgi:hypothetical protein